MHGFDLTTLLPGSVAVGARYRSVERFIMLFLHHYFPSFLTWSHSPMVFIVADFHMICPFSN